MNMTFVFFLRTHGHIASDSRRAVSAMWFAGHGRHSVAVDPVTTKTSYCHPKP